MKKFLTGVLALTICAVINFGLTGEAQATELDSASSLNGVELQELYGPPPPPPGRHHDYGPPPPPPHHRHPPMHRPWHRPGPPPPPPFHRRRHGPPPPPPPPEPYRNQRPRW